MVSDGPQLAGVRALVTGAAGGIGRAIVAGLVAQGARVTAVDLPSDRLLALAARFDGIRAVACDLATADGCDAAIAQADGPIELLVNNAAVLGGQRLLGEVSDSDWEQVLSVNLTAPFMLSARVIDAMLEAGRGCIINVASAAAIRGGRAGLAYTASKHGLVGLTLNIAATLGADGIRANAVCPGGTVGSETLAVGHRSERGTARIAGRDRGRPAGGSPEGIAAAVVWLATPAAGRLNGAVIPVDDGWTAY
jgi:NAD(P)-dependent dehydrogenase (short-subunit alcohol dehydrogenase family)